VVESAPVGALPEDALPDSLGPRRPLEVREEPPSRMVRRTLGCCTGVGVAAGVGVGVGVDEPCGRAARDEDEGMFGDISCDWFAEFMFWTVARFRFWREVSSSTSSESFVWSSTRCTTRTLSDCCFMSMRLVAGRGPRSPSTAATAMRVAGGIADSGASSGAPSGSSWDIAAAVSGEWMYKRILSRVVAKPCIGV
jgi:hypothetical protein